MFTTDIVMRECQRCHVKYDFSRSTSELKLTYCGILCQIGDLGFSLEALLTMEIKPTVKVEEIVQRVDERMAAKAETPSNPDDPEKELVEV